MPEYPPPGDETREFLRVAALIEGAGPGRRVTGPRPDRPRLDPVSVAYTAVATADVEVDRWVDRMAIATAVVRALADAGYLRGDSQ